MTSGLLQQEALAQEKGILHYKKKCLAIVLAVKHFQVYLIGKPFVIQTDHRAL